MCCCPKDQLDDFNTSFDARTKSSMLRKVSEAIQGRYEGWKQDRAQVFERLGRSVPENLTPRSLIKDDGTFAKSRKNQAASRIGRHLLVTFFDDLDGVDLHSTVRQLALNVSCAQSDCVLFTVWLGPNAYNRPRNLGPFVDMHCQQVRTDVEDTPHPHCQTN